MKKIFSTLFLGACAVFALTSCVNDADEPDTSDYLITSPTDIGEVNYSIAQLKTDKSSLFSQTNAFEKVTDDLIIEGVVAANDISGNLYQTLLVRNIDTAAGTDQAIVFAVKNTCLYPYFKLGQRLKINLKGLYIGVYSKVPKIGQPYYTSSGNLRLGPILLQLCQSNVQLIGEPDPTCAECQPVELSPEWLRATANRTYMNYPQLVTVKGTIEEADGTAIFAPDELKDAGYGVDRTLTNSVNNTKVTIRTSTRNDISFTVMPTDERSYTGMLTYYNDWQIQLRSLDDISPKVGE